MFIINMEERCSSGPTPPTATNYQMWYDTTNNLVKSYSGGSDTGDRYSLPIALVQKGDAVESSNISSIDQVFNGFGYIGSTIFSLPGVKGLVPNGRNADGTLKNTTRTTTAVSVYTIGSVANNYEYQLAYNGSLVPFYSHMTYNAEENINYNANGTPSAWAIVGRV